MRNNFECMILYNNYTREYNNIICSIYCQHENIWICIKYVFGDMGVNVFVNIYVHCQK